MMMHSLHSAALTPVSFGVYAQTGQDLFRKVREFRSRLDWLTCTVKLSSPILFFFQKQRRKLQVTGGAKALPD